MNISEKVMHRYKGNPIIVPSQFKDALATFNCGQTTYKGKTALLLPIQKMNDQTPAIYYAESDDGIHFKVREKPFITQSSIRPEMDEWPIDPRISYIPEDDMYYIIRPVESCWGITDTLLKTKDFERYEDMGLVALPDNRVPCLFQGKVNGRYARIDRPYQSSNSNSGNLWLSYSDDLIHWGEYTPLMRPFADWNKSKIGPTPPIKVKEGWLLIIHGVKFGRYSLGAVLLDADDPSKVIAKAKSPILTPNEPYEYMGHVGGPTVFTCGAIVDETKDEIRIYYGAADCAIGLATGKLSELIETMFEESERYPDPLWAK